MYGASFAHVVRVDKDDNVWVVDEGSNMVIKFNPQGLVTLVLGRKAEAIDYIEEHERELTTAAGGGWRWWWSRRAAAAPAPARGERPRQRSAAAARRLAHRPWRFHLRRSGRAGGARLDAARRRRARRAAAAATSAVRPT